MKAIINFKCDVLQYDNSKWFYAELGRLVNKNNYELDSLELYLIQGRDRKAIPGGSYLVIKDGKIVMILDREQRELFEYLQEEEN